MENLSISVKKNVQELKDIEERIDIVKWAKFVRILLCVRNIPHLGLGWGLRGKKFEL